MLVAEAKRRQIADTLSEMADLIIRKEPPFDKVPLHPELRTYLVEYYKYIDEIEHSLKDRFRQYVIESTRDRIEILLDVHRGKEPFAKRCQDILDAEETFVSWLKQRQGPQKPVPIEDSPFAEKNINVNQIVQRVMKERRPDYLFDRGTSFQGHTSFSKPMLDDNKIYIGVDKGMKSRALTFYLGLREPEYFIDIAVFFGGSQSRYKYQNAGEVLKSMHMGLDVIDILLPHFKGRMEHVLGRS